MATVTKRNAVKKQNTTQKFKSFPHVFKKEQLEQFVKMGREAGKSEQEIVDALDRLWDADLEAGIQREAIECASGIAYSVMKYRTRWFSERMERRNAEREAANAAVYAKFFA